MFLPFCIEEKDESEILKLLGLKHRNSRLITSLKACVEVGLLTLLKKNFEGNIASEYVLTALGEQVIDFDLNNSDI